MTVSEDVDDGLLDCEDCGISAWMQDEDGRIVHEDSYVHDGLWDSVCPDDGVVESMVNGEKHRHGRFVMCIGCFEKRLGRRLRREDFAGPPLALFGIPPSTRFVSRWEGDELVGAGERT